MARLEIRLMGAFEATLDGQALTGFAYDKVRALLAYLAVESRRPHARADLAALLWPGEPQGVGLKNLRTALATLRQAIRDDEASPPWLLVSRETLQFNPQSDYQLDVDAVTALLDAAQAHPHPEGGLCDACAERLAQAVQLYRGAFLHSLILTGSVTWDEWALLIREQLHSRLLGALALLMDHSERRGDDGAARQAAWRALALEPWDDAAHRCLMRAFARGGQRAAALAQYERCRRVLRDELGIEPAAETSALAERIRAGQLERPQAAHIADEAPPAHRTDVPPSAMSATDSAIAAAPERAEGGPEPALDRAAHNRARLLAKVRTFWVEGVLERSLYREALIELGLAYRPEAVAHPWPMLVRQPSRPERSIDPGTPIGAVFDSLGGSMLILGAPGSGKTTTLLELARELLARAVQDPAQPIPVVLTLSTWATRRRPLNDWVVDELYLRYQVPRSVGRAWVAAGQIAPLLDGLDEIELAQRPACVAAINAFHNEHWLLSMVVCSRSADYELLTTRLQLQGAVLIQPLGAAQVDRYLRLGGAQLAPVRALLDADLPLRELADTPLMLAIMALAYRDLPVARLSGQMTLEERRRHLFATYVERMLERRGASVYSAQQTLRWLAWLAESMHRHEQASFFIEDLQPEWLPPRWRRIYLGGVGASLGLTAGLLAFIANLQSVLLRHGLRAGLAVLGPLLLAVACTTATGGALGLLLGASPEVGGSVPQDWAEQARDGAQLGLLLSLAYFLTGLIAVGRAGVTLPIIIPLFLVGGIIGASRGLRRIQLVEQYRWSWDKTRARLPGLLATVLLGSTSYGLWGGLAIGLAAGLAGVFVLGLIFGLEGGEVPTRVVPNQGIRASATSALRVNLLCAVIAALLAGTLFGWLTTLREGIIYGVGTATVAVVLITPLSGGLACLQHLVLRALLWCSGVAPWNYARFLDHAAERLFLRKVGGGYIFVHRLLLEHFVGLEPGAPPQAAQVEEQPPDARAAAAALPLAQAPPTLLPAPPTRLLGRDAELAALSGRLAARDPRLLTLVGPPGVGKSRLALEVADTLRSRFADGVVFIALAPLRDAALVLPTLARALGLAERGEQSALELVQHALRPRDLLLVLDNLEHLLDAAPPLAELLATCPRLCILATSRAPLRLRAEQLYPVQPLALPTDGEGATAALQSPAVALFVQRATAVAPEFTLNDENAAAVAAVCARLDGLPLAIELVAGHSATLAPEALLARLDRSLALLADGPRDLPPHQRTMRAAIGWSYDLLGPEAQRLLRQLGVFPGGATVAALAALLPEAEREIGGAPLTDGAVRQDLAALVSQQLVQQRLGDDGESRYGMLELIREYSLEHLEASGEAATARQRQATYYLDFAEAAYAELRGPEARTALARLEAERDNLRAALAWCDEADDRWEPGLQLAGALWPFWQLRGYVGEGRDWISRFLGRAAEPAPPGLARALLGTGWLAYYQDAYRAAAEHGQASRDQALRAGDRGGQAEALNLLGFGAAALDDYPGGIALLEQSIALGRSAEDGYALGFALLNLGFLHNDLGAVERAQPLFAEALQLAERIRQPLLLARVQNALGELARMRGAYAEAGPAYAQSLARYQELGDRRGAAALHHNLGCVALHIGELDQAEAQFRQSLGLYRAIDDPSGSAAALAGLGGVAGGRGRWRAGVTLLGAAFAARAALGAAIIAPDRTDYERWLESCRARLGAAAYAEAWAAGQALALERALALAGSAPPEA